MKYPWESDSDLVYYGSMILCAVVIGCTPLYVVWFLEWMK